MTILPIVTVLLLVQVVTTATSFRILVRSKGIIFIGRFYRLDVKCFTFPNDAVLTVLVTMTISMKIVS